MKDAAWQRYASGRCLATFDPEISEWGNPISVIRDYRPLKWSERTPGSETSQYREEEKLISISLVAASETEEAQTDRITVKVMRKF